MADQSPTPATARFGRIDTLPRATLLAGPTAIEPMPNLRRDLSSGPLYVKRDDLTGFAFGGNKIRQLEFYFGEAQAQGADVILITGAGLVLAIGIIVDGRAEQPVEQHIA